MRDETRLHHGNGRGGGDRLRVGPFEFSFRPDGDDPGVGSVLLEADYASAATPFTVSRATWDEFAQALADSAERRETV